MGLVDYGSSGSDSEGETSNNVAPSIQPKLSSTSSLSLPPPKTILPLPKATTTLPIKKAKGPVRILLDLPSPSASTSSSKNDDEPAKKKPKFTPGTSSGMSGLAMMLPAPKNESVAVMLENALGGSVSKAVEGQEGVGVEEETIKQQERTVSTGFVPYSMAKGKKPATLVKANVRVVADIDFFGLGSSSSVASTSSSTSSYVAPKLSMTISSAPSVNPTTKSSYGSAPTEDDPYPGFVLLPTGQWVAKDQETYDLWVSEHAAQVAEQNAVPKGFEDKDIAKNGMLDVVAEDYSQLVKPVIKPGTEDAAKGKPKTVAKATGGRAKGRHQLSDLLNDAVTNRAELEERIAQGRASRKGSGAKYGF